MCRMFATHSKHRPTALPLSLCTLTNCRGRSGEARLAEPGGAGLRPARSWLKPYALVRAAW